MSSRRQRSIPLGGRYRQVSRYSLPTNLCVVRLQWGDWLWLSDSIWRHRSMSTLAQVKACCLMASSYYLSQCWRMVLSPVTFTSGQFQPSITEIRLKNIFQNFYLNLPGDNKLSQGFVIKHKISPKPVITKHYHCWLYKGQFSEIMWTKFIKMSMWTQSSQILKIN